MVDWEEVKDVVNEFYENADYDIVVRADAPETLIEIVLEQRTVGQRIRLLDALIGGEETC